MRLTFLAHDAGSNAFGRAHVLAKMASRFADVDIVAPSSTGQIWEPLRDDTSIPVRLTAGPRPSRAEVLAGKPDVLYAVKARKASLGIGLRVSKAARLPLVADVDDWELAFYYENRKWWLRQTLRLLDANSFWATLRAERQVRYAAAVTVSSTFLQRRFGGSVIVHARDGELFDPSTADRDAVRSSLGLNERTVVMFMGSPKPHKGLQDVVAALDRLSDPNIVFAVIGAGSHLPKRSWLTVIENRPFAEIPKYVAAADIIVLAQRDGPIANAQVPAKVFDAMAMEKPIITTDVSDLSDIVGPGGYVVPPCDVGRLAAEIHHIASDYTAAALRGKLGRQRFEERYSFDAVSPQLEKIVLGAMNRDPLARASRLRNVWRTDAS